MHTILSQTWIKIYTFSKIKVQVWGGPDPNPKGSYPYPWYMSPRVKDPNRLPGGPCELDARYKIRQG